MSLSSSISSFLPWQVESLSRGRKAGAVIVEPAPLIFAEASDSGSSQFVFTHIPKTGGLTLRAALATVAAFKGWTWEEMLGAPVDAVAAYHARAPERLRAARFVWGHLPFGLHDPRMPHVTLLRDPVELILSHYAMGVARGHLEMGTPLAALFADNICVDNPQTRLLSGLPAKLNPGSVCDQATFELARANLATHYMLAADMARIAEFLAVMRAVLRAPPLLYFRRNIRAVDFPDGLAQSFTAEAEARAQFDMALFESVKDKVRVGMELEERAAIFPNQGCLAFRDETAKKFVHEPHGPDRLAEKMRSEGVAVKRHSFDPAGLDFVKRPFTGQNLPDAGAARCG